MALNNSNNNNNTNCQLSGSSKNFKNGSTSKVTSCNITAPTSNANTATLKTLTSKTKINEVGYNISIVLLIIIGIAGC